MHPAMTFTGTDVDLARLAGCVFGVTAGRRRAGPRRGARRRPRRPQRVGARGASARSTTPVSRTAPTTSSPWSPRRWSCCAAAGADDPAGTLRPLLTAALDNALDHGDAALTGPIVRGDVETVRAHLAEIARPAPHTLPSYVAMARATANRAVTDGRLLPIRARQASSSSSTRAAGTATGRAAPTGAAAVTAPPVAAHPRRARRRCCADARAGRRHRVGLVPTMGALHDGPRRAGARGRASVGADGRSWCRSSSTRCSSAPGEDLDRYPRTLDADLEVCAREGVDVVFAPTVDEVYPGGEPAGDRRPRAARRRCSRAGPGPATSAACSPSSPSCSAWSGPTSRSSARRTTSSSCWSAGWSPTSAWPSRSSAPRPVREPDGLALSSRNRYLDAEQRAGAAALSAAPARGAAAAAPYGADARSTRPAPSCATRPASTSTTSRSPPPTWRAARRPPGEARLLVAARVGSTRLIDNVAVHL